MPEPLIVWVVEGWNEHLSRVHGVYRTKEAAFAEVEMHSGGAVRLYLLEGSEAYYVGKGVVFGEQRGYAVSRHTVKDDA